MCAALRPCLCSAFFGFAGLALVCVPGCGRSTYPVVGQIELGDGSSAKDLEGYQIIFEGQQEHVSAVGTIRADGSFELDTFRAADGAKPGKYKVLIQPPPPANPDGPPVKSLLLERYRQLKTTNLEAHIKAEPNHIKLTVERASKRK